MTVSWTFGFDLMGGVLTSFWDMVKNQECLLKSKRCLLKSKAGLSEKPRGVLTERQSVC